MNMRAWIPAILALGLAGCSTTPSPPFTATWYLVNQKGQNNAIYVAILNQSNQPQTIQSVLLNGSQGRRWQLSDKTPIRLEPGELLIRPSSQFSNFPAKCHLPVHVTIQTQGTPAEIAITGRLPNLLPEGWETCP